MEKVQWHPAFADGIESALRRYQSNPSFYAQILSRRGGYEENREKKHESYCTFPFFTDTIVTLEGNFLDRLEESKKNYQKSLEKTESTDTEKW